MTRDELESDMEILAATLCYLNFRKTAQIIIWHYYDYLCRKCLCLPSEASVSDLMFVHFTMLLLIFSSCAVSVNETMPTLVLLWDPFCSHCSAFRPLWYEWVKSKENKFTELAFEDINCFANKKVCKDLDVDSYPSIIYIYNNQSIHYHGTITIDGISAFLEKQLSFPVKFIETESELEDIKQKTRLSSVFYMEYISLDDPEFTLFRSVAQRMRELDSLFIARKSNINKLQVLRDVDVSIDYNDNWTNVSMTEFVEHYKYPILPPLTAAVVDETIDKNDTFVVVFVSSENYYKVSHTIPLLNTDKQIFYDAPNSSLANYIGVEKPNQFVLFDPVLSRWSRPDHDDLNSLQLWFNSLNSIADENWNGPGTHMIRSLWEYLWSLKTIGGIQLYLVIFLILFILVLIVCMIIECFGSQTNPKKE